MDNKKKDQDENNAETTQSLYYGIEEIKNKRRSLERETLSSKKMVSIEISIMLWSSKYRDRLCSTERNFEKEIGKHLVILIGNRGFGCESRIKGFYWYGGKWKQMNHERYTTAAIANEKKTSKICVFCFCPIIHTKQRVERHGKSVLKEYNGVMQYINPRCISIIDGQSIQSCDKVT